MVTPTSSSLTFCSALIEHVENQSYHFYYTYFFQTRFPFILILHNHTRGYSILGYSIAVSILISSWHVALRVCWAQKLHHWNANFGPPPPILLKHGSFERYGHTDFRSILTSEAPDLQESGTVLKVSKMTLWRQLLKYHFTCTDFAQTWLIWKIWIHWFQIHFNIGGTRPPGVRNSP